jgi:hypothetical protein
MSPIAIIKMVYDDDIYLEIWLKYWEQFVPRSNLYVLIHDQYEKYEDICKGCNTIACTGPHHIQISKMPVGVCYPTWPAA